MVDANIFDGANPTDTPDDDAAGALGYAQYVPTQPEI
jgi:hypothetical protein